jgi:hypothetical protein
MIPRVRECYTRAAELINAYATIPSLDAMCELYDKIGAATYRDGFHANYGAGRYLLGCVWLKALCGKDAIGNPYRDFDVAVTEEEVLLAQEIAKAAVEEFGTPVC